MKNEKRKIEVFTAGCGICNDTVKLIKEAVSDCGCEVIERHCGEEQCEDGKRYGITTMPSVVVDGELVFEGAITKFQAALLTR